MDPAVRCQVTGCEKSAAATLREMPLCLAHFISTSYEKIDGFMDGLRVRRASGEVDEAVWSFLNECCQQATHLGQHGSDLSNLDRARLFDILISANDLRRRLRRSARIATPMQVRIHCAEPGRHWEEETQATQLSRHGALLEAQHAVRVGDTLEVIRSDNARRAGARVIWFHRKGEARYEFGIEFVDCENFWGENK